MDIDEILEMYNMHSSNGEFVGRKGHKEGKRFTNYYRSLVKDNNLKKVLKHYSKKITDINEEFVNSLNQESLKNLIEKEADRKHFVSGIRHLLRFLNRYHDDINKKK